MKSRSKSNAETEGMNSAKPQNCRDPYFSETTTTKNH